ncbi:hypothetical protein SEA_WEASELS2_159 [Rhodococcus phage Weasels2]|uniref:Uncharacterized protein n=1 Tax=Rhodococcus phage Weasels2 TaxID=1897437 RepID=A0A1I9SAD3_9CAUD|nr:hypothetical protein FDH04_gp255 [Rhodococcus phage Weasels2]AOZ63739.1 hypothetical protein SEA_WEASELS2_159 [Rhodococcus phage Weasels2]
MCKGVAVAAIAMLVLFSLFSAYQQDERRISNCKSVGGYPSSGQCLIVKDNKIVEIEYKEYNG